LQKSGKVKQQLIQKDLKALDACSFVERWQSTIVRSVKPLPPLHGMHLKLIIHRTITISNNESLVIDQSFKRLFLDVLAIHNVHLHLYIKEWRLEEHIRLYNNLKAPKLCQNCSASKSSLRISFQSSYLISSRVLRACIWFVVWAPLIVYQVFSVKHFSL